MIASVLERKVWARTRGSNLYPNLYVVLVGPPGIGKSAILSHSERMLRAMEPDLHVAPSSVTTASVIDSLAAAERKIIRTNATPNFVQFNSLQVVASELGVFLPQYDPAFMNTLTKLYDGEIYEERRRASKVQHVKIEYPLLSILGGTTPSYLNSFLPEGAWDQGFTSRTILVYCGEQAKPDLWKDDGKYDNEETLLRGLMHDLKQIHQLFGKVEWDRATMQALSAWDHAGGPPAPEHGKLTHYNSRRTAHLIKLCVIAAIARSNDLHITIEDYNIALSWLLEAEAQMPDIFRSYGVSQDARTIEDCWYFVFQAYTKTKKPVGEHRIVSFLSSRAPSHQVTKIIEIMVKAKALTPDVSTGILGYIPAARKPDY